MSSLASSVMSHFEIELSSEHLNNWRMVHLQEIDFLRILDCSEIKKDRLDEVIPRGPINVC